MLLICLVIWGFLFWFEIFNSIVVSTKMSHVENKIDAIIWRTLKHLSNFYIVVFWRALFTKAVLFCVIILYTSDFEQVTVNQAWFLPFMLVTTLQQRLLQPDFQPICASQLYPRHKHLLIKRSLRCRVSIPFCRVVICVREKQK